jgi:GntR family transcriptional regulator/MocR family aminotransferase
MARRRYKSETSGISSIIPLRTSTRIPIRHQLYEGLRGAIQAGQLAGGVQLPSTRALARELEISRSTVLNAYQRLLLEGYVEGRHGAGTYIARNAPSDFLASTAPSGLPPRGWQYSDLPSPLATHDRACARPPALAGAATGPDKLSPVLSHTAFPVGQPALDAFPLRHWERLMARRLRQSWQDLSGYQPSAGYQPLREAIAAYVGMARGVRCLPKQVLVVAGSQQGLDLTARVLLHAGDAVWMEEPGYDGARAAFCSAGARLLPVPVDEHGMNVDYGIQHYPEARLAYVTPSHQFPLGATLGLERRLALLEWARARQAWVVEDDYDGEFRYAGRPVAALQGLDTAGRVIYLGTFSKVLFPSLRLGYMVVPADLVDLLVEARTNSDAHSPGLEQAVLADFIAEGHFTRHIRRMRQLYAHRQARFREALNVELPTSLEPLPDSAGMHLVIQLPDGVNDLDVMDRVRAAGVRVNCLSQFSLRPPRNGGLVLGYAAANEPEMRDGVRKLAAVLRDLGI